MSMVHCTARAQEYGLLAIPRDVWDELALKPGDELAVSLHPTGDRAGRISDSGRLDSATREEARIAAINAAAGKYAHLGVSVEDLHRERRLDEARDLSCPSGDRS